MGFSNKKVVEAAVDLYGVTEYAESELDDQPIRARVELSEHGELDFGCHPLALLIPLCASRLLSLARRAPTLAPPIMAVLGACADALTGSDDPAAGRDFRVRRVVVTDPEALAMDVHMSGGQALPTAQVNSALPVVESQPEGSAERSTHLLLMAGRNGRPWGRFKFPRRSANPMITNTALCATLEHCARQESFEQVTRPAAAGLAALVDVWEELGSPYGTSVSASTAIDGVIIDAVVGETSSASG